MMITKTSPTGAAISVLNQEIKSGASSSDIFSHQWFASARTSRADAFGVSFEHRSAVIARRLRRGQIHIRSNVYEHFTESGQSVHLLVVFQLIHPLQQKEAPFVLIVADEQLTKGVYTSLLLLGKIFL